jgi:hypothetical protein
LHATAIATWEWQYRTERPWLDETWAPHEVALIGFGALVIGAAWFVLEPEDSVGRVNVAAAVALVTLVVAIMVAMWYYQVERRDRFMVTAAGASGLALAAVVVGRVLLVDLKMDTFGFLLIALFVVAEITYGLRWLREALPPAELEA